MSAGYLPGCVSRPTIDFLGSYNDPIFDDVEPSLAAERASTRDWVRRLILAVRLGTATRDAIAWPLRRARSLHSQLINEEYGD